MLGPITGLATIPVMVLMHMTALTALPEQHR